MCFSRVTASNQVGAAQEEKEQSGRLVLQVELPTFPHAVVYQQAATAPATPADLAGTTSDRSGPNLQIISDPEVLICQLCCSKHPQCTCAYDVCHCCCGHCVFNPR